MQDGLSPQAKASPEVGVRVSAEQQRLIEEQARRPHRRSPPEPREDGARCERLHHE